jgi:enoyl-CoA hydratase/carnithine racemase
MERSAFQLESRPGLNIIRLTSPDGTNRLTADLVRSLTARIIDLSKRASPLIICGNDRFFSAGADLTEIAALNGPKAYEFAKMGQVLMDQIADFPAPIYAAISGYCMGGGLDLALACHHRIASPDSVFGHRGAALGLMTGWGGTQRLSRIIGKGRALQMFVAAEKLNAHDAMELGLVNGIHAEPVEAAIDAIGRVREL